MLPPPLSLVHVTSCSALSLREREVIPKQTSMTSWISIAFAVALALLFPFIRKVDDLFNVSIYILRIRT